MRRWPVATLFSLVAPAAAEARAALPDDCPGLGAALVDHSCFHSTYGPFATRRAMPGVSALPDTENLDAVHTEYRVGLAGSESTVTYAPNRSGAFSVFLGADIPLRMLDSGGEQLEPLLDFYGNTGCDALPVAHVFELAADRRYGLVFGPTFSREVVVVIEYVDDFLIEDGRDADGDGYGDPSDTVRSVCVPPSGYVQNVSDCNDQDASIHPEAAERCGDTVDQNCNGLVDDVGLSCSVGRGACRTNGELRCEGGAVACSAVEGSGHIESCNGVDDDCNERVDDGPDLCADADRPACVRDELGAFCGCLLDLDCGPEDSGRICDPLERRCLSGCSDDPGGNGCPPGARCELGNPGRCVDDAGAGGAPVDGGPDPSAGRGGTAGGGDADNVVTTEPGCACNAGGGKQPPPWLAMLGAAAIAGALRRREGRGTERWTRTAWLAISVLAFACGGKSVFDDGGAAGTSHEHPRAGSGGAGLGGSAGASCIPELGEEPIEHACSHTTLGPFVEVAALSSGRASPANVSELQTAFEVDVVESDARLSYVAVREGTHVFFTDRHVDLVVRDERNIVRAGELLPVPECSTIAFGLVVELRQGGAYTVEIASTSVRTFTLFIEHLGTFGNAAWSRRCAG